MARNFRSASLAPLLALALAGCAGPALPRSDAPPPAATPTPQLTPAGWSWNQSLTFASDVSDGDLATFVVGAGEESGTVSATLTNLASTATKLRLDGRWSCRS